jgi:serine/threonine protein kinase
MSISAENIRSIESEVNLLKKLDHPNIVKYIEYIQTKKHINIILEYVEGGSLHYILKQSGKMGEHLVFIFVKQILEGLVYLHNQGIIHRDIKGANLLLTKNGIIKLADFGYSILNDKNKANSIVGTSCWMAPEVIEQKGNISPKCDIWSLGSTIIQLLTTQPPYYEFDAMAAMFRIVRDKCPPLPNGISDNLRDFLLRCFEKDPENRASAKELLKHPWITIPNKKLVKKFIYENDNSAIPVNLINEWKNNYRDNLASIASCQNDNGNGNNNNSNNEISPKSNSHIDNYNEEEERNIKLSNNNIKGKRKNMSTPKQDLSKYNKLNDNDDIINNNNSDNNISSSNIALVREINLLIDTLQKAKNENILKGPYHKCLDNLNKVIERPNDESDDLKIVVNNLILINIDNENHKFYNESEFIYENLVRLHNIISKKSKYIYEFINSFSLVQFIQLYSSKFMNGKILQILINITNLIVLKNPSLINDVLVYQTIFHLSRYIHLFPDVEIQIEMICLIFQCLGNVNTINLFLGSGGIYLLTTLINPLFLQNNEILLIICLDFILYILDKINNKIQDLSLLLINNKLLTRLNLIIIDIFNNEDASKTTNEVNDMNNNIIIERIFTLLNKFTYNSKFLYIICNDKIMNTLIQTATTMTNNQIESLIQIFDNIMSDANNLNKLENLGFIDTLLKLLNNFAYNDTTTLNSKNIKIINSIINQINNMIKLNKARSELFAMSDGIDIMCSLANNNNVENNNEDLTYIIQIIYILSELINASDYTRNKLKQSKTLGLIVKLLMEKKDLNMIKELTQIILDWYSEDKNFIEDYIIKDEIFFGVFSNLNEVLSENVSEYLSLLNDFFRASEEIENKFFKNNSLVKNVIKVIENNNCINNKDIHLMNKIMDFLEFLINNRNEDKEFLNEINFMRTLEKIKAISKERHLIIIDEKIKNISQHLKEQKINNVKK